MNLKLLAEESDKLDKEVSPAFFDVTVKGMFFIEYFPDFGHLGWLRARFLVDEVKSAKLVIDPTVKPDFNSDAPIIGTSERLLDKNWSMMSAIFGDSRSGPLDKFIKNDAKIVFNDSFVNIERLIRFSKSEVSGHRFYRTSGLNKNGNEWILSGSVDAVMKDRSDKKFFYECTYSEDVDKSVKLIQVRLFEEK